MVKVRRRFVVRLICLAGRHNMGQHPTMSTTLSTSSVYFLTVTNQCLCSVKKEEACFTFILDVVCPHPVLVVLASELLSFARKQVLYSSEVCCFFLTSNAVNVVIVRISVV